jgi:hypothetical protein
VRRASDSAARKHPHDERLITTHQNIAGIEANQGMALSKTQSKKAHFADAVSMDKGASLCDRCKALQSEKTGISQQFIVLRFSCCSSQSVQYRFKTRPHLLSRH